MLLRCFLENIFGCVIGKSQTPCTVKEEHKKGYLVKVNAVGLFPQSPGCHQWDCGREKDYLNEWFAGQNQSSDTHAAVKMPLSATHLVLPIPDATQYKNIFFILGSQEIPVIRFLQPLTWPWPSNEYFPLKGSLQQKPVSWTFLLSFYKTELVCLKQGVTSELLLKHLLH